LAGGAKQDIIPGGVAFTRWEGRARTGLCWQAAL